MTAEELKTIRMKLNYTQPDLARTLGVKGHIIWRWEHGQREIPLMVERFLELLLRLHKAKISIE